MSDMKVRVTEIMAAIEECEGGSHKQRIGSHSSSSLPTMETTPSGSESSHGSYDEAREYRGRSHMIVEESSDDESDEESFEGDSMEDESDSGTYSASEAQSSSRGDSRRREHDSHTTNSRTHTRGGSMSSSVMTSSDWSDSDDGDESDYDDLMAEMPIALGRVGAARPSQGRPAHIPPAPSQFGSQPPEGLPVPATIPQNMDESPLEGLAMLQNIRAELEQVGRLIVAKKDGEKFLQRAHILASINWLSANVPSCVLEHLGKEIRVLYNINQQGQEGDDVGPSESFGAVLENRPANKHLMHDINVIEDDGSEASDLSDAHHSDEDDDHSESESSAGGDDFMFDEAFATLPAVRPEVTVSWNPDEATNVQDSREPDRGVQRFSSFNSFDSFASEEHCSVKGIPLPSVEYFQCALLFVDISGFTRLSTLLDPENLSKVINSYFQKIVDLVSEFQGDIQKFAGDALFAEWRVSPTMSLEQCVEAAAACSAMVVRECADYPVIAFGESMFGQDENSPISTLNVHCGLGCGEMAGVHVGDDMDRREYLYLGDPILQAGEACDKADLGECVASLRFNYVLKRLVPTMVLFIELPTRRQSHHVTCRVYVQPHFCRS
jgi:class 3 adenylate cyclase